MAADTVTIASVVEGYGEVQALPVLLRRIAYELGVYELDVPKPNRASRATLATPNGIVRAVQQGAYRVRNRGGVLVLFDADDDCPKDLVERLLSPARGARPDRNVSLVVARKEFEAWFLAAAGSLAGKCGLPEDFAWTGDPEDKRDAKGVISDALRDATGHSYQETVDQARLAAAFDMAEARKASASFDKFWREVATLCAANIG